MSALERFHQIALLGMLLASYLAVVSAQVLDLPTVLLAGAALAVRILMATRLVRLPQMPESIATVAAFLYLGFYPIDYYVISQDFLGATVHLVFFLASVLLLRARGNRDYALLEIVAFLQILAAAAVSQSGAFVLFLALFFLFGTAAATARNMLKQGAASGQSTPTLGLRRSLTRLAVGQFAAMLVLGVGFFFFLPRTARAALEHWLPNRFHVSGFSNSVTLGQIGEIRMNSTPVMHARLYNPVPARELKWRGATLALFDGKRWFNPPSRAAADLKVETNLAILVPAPQQGRVGRRVFYDVRTRPASSDVLFFLGTPELLQINAKQVERLPGNGYRLAAPADQIRYTARSVLNEPLQSAAPADPSLPPLGTADRDLYLQLPSLDPRVTALAASIAPDENAAARALAMERYLSTQLHYTTELPSQTPADPIADFLFRRKEGHCEYFASAMALMLRSQGIPSRIVTGYQSGVFNPLTEWYLIRAADAHSWVEAYIPGRGWQSFDPTPSGPAGAPASLLSKLALYADAMEVFWQEWVVGYDQERQMALAGRVGRSRRWQGWRWDGWENRVKLAWNQFDWRQAAIWATGAIGLLGLLWSLPKLRRQWLSRRQKQRALSGHAEASDATLLYLHMADLLKRQGMERPAWMTPAEFAATHTVRKRAPLAEGVTEAYNDLRFGNHQESAGRLAGLLSDLEAGLR